MTKLAASPGLNVRIGIAILLLNLSSLMSWAVLVAWDPNPISEGVKGYKIYISDSNGTVTNDVGRTVIAALPDLAPGNTYVIELTAYNSAGESERSAALFYTAPIGAILPRLVSPVQDLALKAGESASLSATFSGTPPLRFDWFRGDILVQTNSPILKLAKAELTDSGPYRVRVSNPLGVVTNLVANVSVTPPPVRPSIELQPQSLFNVAESSPAAFMVEVEGTPPFYYQWRKGNQIIAGANARILNIPSVGISDAGMYSVRVANVAGFRDSSPAELSVVPLALAVPPAFTVQPGSTNVALGDPLELIAVASGTAPIQYQWWKDGFPIEGATNSTFQIDAIEPLNAGSYQCEAINAVNRDFSAEAVVTTFVRPPSILIQPVDQYFSEGELVVLNVGVSGNEPLEYAWFRKGELEPHSREKENIFLATLESAAEYFVIVSNSGGAVTSRVASLTVLALEDLDPPLIISDPVSTIVMAGDRAEFAVVATGPGNLAYQWYKNGQFLPGANGSVLAFDRVTVADAGDYSVTISSLGGMEVSEPARLTVNVDITSNNPTELRVVEGAPLILSSGRTLISSNCFWFKDEFSIPVLTGNRLVFDRVLETDAGRYMLIIVENLIPRTVGIIDLTVIRFPSIESPPESLLLPVSARAEFSISAQPLDVDYVWLKNGHPISGATNANFVIPEIDDEDAGVYAVRISNEAGSFISIPATLSIARPPRIVSQNIPTLAFEHLLTTLSIEIVGTPPFEVTWYRDGNEIPGATNDILNFEASPQVEGIFRARVANAFGDVWSIPEPLRVVRTPIIEQQPGSVRILVGSSAALSVAAAHATAYQWYKDGLPLPQATHHDIRFTNASTNDTGDYQLVAGNESAQVFSRMARVEVVTHFPPQIAFRTPDPTIALGADVLLAVRAAGMGPLTYRWHQNGHLLNGITTPNLLILGAAPQDAGIYTATVSNPGGSASVEIRLSFSHGSPPPLLPMSIEERIPAKLALMVPETAIEERLNRMFILQYSTNLSVGNWHDLGTAVADENGTVDFSITSDFADSSQGFLRLR